jgi:hypothetical protein
MHFCGYIAKYLSKLYNSFQRALQTENKYILRPSHFLSTSYIIVNNETKAVNKFSKLPVKHTSVTS